MIRVSICSSLKSATVESEMFSSFGMIESTALTYLAMPLVMFLPSMGSHQCDSTSSKIRVVIGANLTNDEKRAYLIDIRGEHLIDQVCPQEILPPEK